VDLHLGLCKSSVGIAAQRPRFQPAVGQPPGQNIAQKRLPSDAITMPAFL